MNSSELATAIGPRARADAGAFAGLAALTIGVIVNIAWLLLLVVALLQFAFAD